MQYYLVSDFFLDEIPGGAESSDDALIKRLAKHNINLKKIKALQVTEVDPKAFYILSNRTSINKNASDQFCEYKNYITIEHDYQFLKHRNPYNEGVDYVGIDLYKNAKMVVLQSKFQHKFYEHMYRDNNINPETYVMSTTIYTEEELRWILSLSIEPVIQMDKAAVPAFAHPLKGRDFSIRFCKNNAIDYDVIPYMERDKFLKTLRRYNKIVFFPLTPETHCRFAVECRILGLQMVTLGYGATTEPWFELSGKQLVETLDTLCVKHTAYIANKIKEFTNA